MKSSIMDCLLSNNNQFSSGKKRNQVCFPGINNMKKVLNEFYLNVFIVTTFFRSLADLIARKWGNNFEHLWNILTWGSF